MPTPEPRVSESELREAARGAVEDAGLRAAAREIGINPSVLRDVINHDRNLQTKTVRRLEAWYRGLPEPAVRRMIAFLVQRLPRETRDEDAGELLATLARLHRRRQVPLPAWMRDSPGQNRGA